MQIGVDIGGTFTDIVALDRTGRLALPKVPSTPKDLLDGIATATARVLALAGAAPGDVERFIHGTTVATNAVLEQKVPSKKMIVLHPGDQLWEHIAGGAGHGDPLDRNPAAVLADVLDGKIATSAEYGVVLTPDGAAVDEVKTKERRAGLAGRRTGGGGR